MRIIVAVISLLLLIVFIRKSSQKQFTFIKDTLKPYQKELFTYFLIEGINENDLYPLSQILGVVRNFILESKVNIEPITKEKLLNNLSSMVNHLQLNGYERELSIGIFK